MKFSRQMKNMGNAAECVMLFEGTGSRFSSCLLIKLLFSNLLLILSVNNPPHMYYRVTWSGMEEY